MKYQWQVNKVDWAQAEQLAKELGVSRLLAALLIMRGYTTLYDAQAFLHPSLDDLADPLLLPDAQVAVNRLVKAIQDRETILIYGDYDADGITATALWTWTLRKLGGKAHPMLPHRERDGYDLQRSALEAARKINASLILTCDCGTRAHEVIEEARDHLLDVIVTDHHTPGSELPPALAIVNPHRRDSQYPFPDLCGVGVSFRLGEALISEMGLKVESYRNAFLDLVAIGTVADVMPLVGENRVLVTHGLRNLAQTRKAGLQQLLAVADINLAKGITPYHIGYQIGPRLNAAGRIDDARHALELLLTKDAALARTLAEDLSNHNRQRQELQENIYRQAIAMIEREDLLRHKVILIASEDWLGGVIGIAAGKLTKRYYRPVFIANIDREEGVVKGSIRSPDTISLLPLLDVIDPFCTKCGGHPAAGGFSAELDRLPALSEALLRFADTYIDEALLEPVLRVDMEVSASEITPALVDELQQLAPFGHGNPAPLFLCREVEVQGCRVLGKDGKHTALTLCAPGINPTRALLWGVSNCPLSNGTKIDVVFAPQINTYNGNNAVEWTVSDYEVV
jgi:single-stranded-DNA-specific exonuclease